MRGSSGNLKKALLLGKKWEKRKGEMSSGEWMVKEERDRRKSALL